MFGFNTRLAKSQFTTFILIAVSNVLCFFAVLTPSWQVADDTDINRTVESGLWIYCPGQQQCWYIFSDNLINYYERVDVCRFLLVADCRKKLLRTPYFFGWHYAVLILLLCTMALNAVAMAALAYSYLRPRRYRIGTIVMDSTLFFAFILICIGLMVFMINAEMLEAKYLIGVKNTFLKQYGYSYYLAVLSLVVMLFAVLSALVVTTLVFFFGHEPEMPSGDDPAGTYGSYIDNARMNDYVMQTQRERQLKAAQTEEGEALEGYNGGGWTGRSTVPRYCYSPSVDNIPTRTFLSY